jgi:hypothetical protein
VLIGVPGLMKITEEWVSLPQRLESSLPRFELVPERLALALRLHPDFLEPVEEGLPSDGVPLEGCRGTHHLYCGGSRPEFSLAAPQ